MDFSRKMKPVYDLLKVEEDVKTIKDKRSWSKRKITWLPEHQQIIQDVVDYLKSPQVIAYPDFTRPFLIHCDASNTGLGGVLYQRQDASGVSETVGSGSTSKLRNDLKVISFASRTLSPAEKNYHLHSGKLEFLALKWCITEKFHHYLYGNGLKFTVFTDNNPLTYVLSSAKLNATGLRWVAQLSDYLFDIKYKPGKLNIDADYLSRHPIDTFAERENDEENEEIKSEDVGVIFNEASRRERILADAKFINASVWKLNVVSEVSERISREDIRSAQQQDATISPVYHAVESGGRLLEGTAETKVLWKQRKRLCMENGVLMRQTSTRKQIILPKMYRDLVYRELHANMGHLGSEKVIYLARKRFYWTYMTKDIEHFIQKKCPCIKSKKPNVPDRAPLKPVVSTHPFEMVSIDFLQLDRCKGGYKYALVICDHFTRFTQILPTKSKSVNAAAEQIFNKFILYFGFPLRIHSDQGTEFNNKLFKKLLQLSGIDKSRTTPYHPEGDGQPERFNRTVLNMLKCLTSDQKKDWSRHVAKLAFAYNSMVNKSTGYSPFYLLFGRESRLPIDYIFGINLDDDGTSCGKRRYDNFVEEWENSMKEAVDIAKRHVEAAHKWNEKSYNKKVRGVKVVVGDKVLLRNRSKLPKGSKGKLRSYWDDCIYTVLEVDENVPVLTVRDEAGKKAPKRIHRNNILLCNDLARAEKDEQSTRPAKVAPAKNKTAKLKLPNVVRKSSNREIFSSSDSDEDYVYAVVPSNFQGGEGVMLSETSEEETVETVELEQQEVTVEASGSETEETAEEAVVESDGADMLEEELTGSAGSDVEEAAEEAGDISDESTIDTETEEDSNASFASNVSTPPRRGSRTRKEVIRYPDPLIGK